MSLEKMVIKRNTNIMSGSGKKLILNLISLSGVPLDRILLSAA